MEKDKVWRSIKMPVNIADKISDIAKEERRSFTGQALIILEKGLEGVDASSNQTEAKS